MSVIQHNEVMRRGNHFFLLCYWITEFISCSCLNPVSLSHTVRSLFSLCLLLWFFSFCGLFCLLPRQKVVGDQSCEEVCSHASVSSEHQTQRLCQHKQTEHIHWCPVVQFHPITLHGVHYSKKIHQCHCRVEGQFRHDAEDQGAPNARKLLDLTCWKVV